MILFYASGHGLGHLSRENEVICALKHISPDLRIALRTPAAEWFVKDIVPDDVIYEPVSIDVGVLQSDSLNVKPLQTLKAYAKLIERKNSIIEVEIEWCRKNSVKLIVADIPPLAFDIAEKLNLPSICIANFSWDWIYAPYVQKYPEYQFVIDNIINSESKCPLCLFTPFSGDLSAFPQRQPLPLIGRKSQLSRAEIRLRLNLPQDAPGLLFSFGGFGLKIAPELETDLPAGTIILTTQGDTVAENWRYIGIDEMKNLRLKYQDLVNASDAVITKPGYGIVSECIANRTGMIYLPREDFAEYEVLVEGMKRHIPAVEMTPEDFSAGKWNKYLDILLNHSKKIEPLTVNGAVRAAEIILDSLAAG